MEIKMENGSFCLKDGDICYTDRPYRYQLAGHIKGTDSFSDLLLAGKQCNQSEDGWIIEGLFASGGLQLKQVLSVKDNRPMACRLTIRRDDSPPYLAAYARRRGQPVQLNR